MKLDAAVKPQHVGGGGKCQQALAFLEKVGVYQSPDAYTDMFQAYVFQADNAAIFEVVGADALKAQGGIAYTPTKLAVFTQSTWVLYLLSLSQQLQSSGEAFSGGVGFTVGLQGLVFGGHSLGIYYEVKEGIPYFRFMDINHKGSELYAANDKAALANMVKAMFEKYPSLLGGDQHIIEIKAVIKQALLATHAISEDEQAAFLAHFLPAVPLSESGALESTLTARMALQNADLVYLGTQKKEDILSLVHAGTIAIHGDTWKWLLSNAWVTEEDFLKHPCTPAYAPDLLLEILESKPLDERLESIKRHEIFEKLLDKFSKNPAMPFVLKQLFGLIPAERHRDFSIWEILHKNILLGVFDDDTPLLLEKTEVFLRLMLEGESAEKRVRICTNMIHWIPEPKVLAFLLEEITPEQRYAALQPYCYQSGFNRFACTEYPMHQFVQYPRALEVILSKLPPEYHVDIITAQNNRCQNLLHMVVTSMYRGSSDLENNVKSLALLIDCLPPEVRFHTLTEVHDDGGRSVLDVASEQRCTEAALVIKNALSLDEQERLAQSAVSRKNTSGPIGGIEP